MGQGVKLPLAVLASHVKAPILVPVAILTSLPDNETGESSRGWPSTEAPVSSWMEDTGFDLV